MRKKRNLYLALVLIAAMVAMTGCTTFDNFKEAFFSSKGTDSETIRIGVLEPQTGNDSDEGELEIQGIELANQLVGQVLGKEIELVYADTQSSIYVAESAVADLIDKEPVVVLGSYGEAVSLVASQALEEAKIPAIAITATNPLITQNNEYYFRVSFTDASQGEALAEYVYENMGLSKAAVVRIKDEDTTTEMVSEFSGRLRKLTEDEDCISATVELDAKNADYAECIEKIQASGVSAVFMPVSIATAEKIFEEAQKAGLNQVSFIGSKDWHTDELLEIQARYPNIQIVAPSSFLSSDSVSDNSAVSDSAEPDAGTDTDEDVTAEDTEEKESLYDQFIKVYQETYGESNPPEETVLGFDAYMIAVQAIEQASETDGYTVKEALKATKSFQGASGEISFDDSGEPKKPINIDVIRDGKFVTVYTVK